MAGCKRSRADRESGGIVMTAIEESEREMLQMFVQDAEAFA